MKKLTCVLFTALLLTTLFAHPATNGREQMKLRGPVRSITTTTGEDEYLYRETITFDPEGNLLHAHILDMGVVFADADYSYEYDEAGRVLSIIRPTNEGDQSETFMYDEEGRLFLSVKYSEGAGIEFTERTYWDLQGRKALGTIHEWNELVWVESYSYDTEGQIAQTLRPASHYSRLGYSTHEYDEWGNEILCREWELPNELYIQTRREYTYDAIGNILSSLKYTDYGEGEGEVLEEVTRYEYKYFED